MGYPNSIIAGWLMENPINMDNLGDLHRSWLVQQDSFTTPRAVVSLRFFNCYWALSVIFMVAYYIVL